MIDREHDLPSAVAGTVAPHRRAATNAKPIVFITLNVIFLFCVNCRSVAPEIGPDEVGLNAAFALPLIETAVIDEVGVFLVGVDDFESAPMCVHKMCHV